MDEHGGNIYKFGKDIIDFSANINPLGLSEEMKKILTKNIDAIIHYPDPEYKDLIKSIADYWQIHEENILLGNGSSELIYLVVSTFRPERTLIPVPSFSEYERAAKSVGSKIRFLRLKERDGFILNESSFNRADVLFICNPNNPTGNLVRIPKFNGLKVIDETFMDFLPDENRYTMVRESVKRENIIVIRTFTKFFAMPGLRIGYLIAHKELIGVLRQNLPPWNINSLAQIAGAVLKDKEYIEKTREVVQRERRFLFERISRISTLKPYPSVANFILVKINPDAPCASGSSSLKEKLIQKGILIRDCSNFRGLDNKYFRIAIRSHKENKKLIDTLESIL